MSGVHIKVLLWLSLAVIQATTTSGESPHLLLQSSPARIYPGMTGGVTLTCDLEPVSGSGSGSGQRSDEGSRSEIVTLISLILSKSDTVGNNVTKLYREIASVTLSDPSNVQVKDSLGGEVRGQLKGVTSSYITVKWPSVSDDIPGSYKCDAFGMDSSGHPRTMTVKGTDINIGSITIEELIKQLAATQATMQTTIADLNRRLSSLATSTACQQCQCQPNMAARINQSMAAMEEGRSEVYRGSYYFLSRLTSINHPEYQSYCSLYGGYLAEIDDQDEFDFVQNFTQMFAQTDDFIALGGTDQGHEQVWTYLSGGPMTYTDWFPGQPQYTVRNNGTEATSKHHCLYTSGHWDWQMVSYNCFRGGKGSGRFLYEIPDDGCGGTC